MLETKDYYAKLHMMSKRMLRKDIENVIKTQLNKSHDKDENTLKVKINNIKPFESMNPSFYKFDIKLPNSIIQNNHNKVVYAISIWDRKTGKMIKASNFKSPNFYVISKHKPTILFSISVEF